MTVAHDERPDHTDAARLAVLGAAAAHDPDGAVSPSLWARVLPHYTALSELLSATGADVAAELARHGHDPGRVDRRRRLEAATVRSLDADARLSGEVRRLLGLIAEAGRLLPYQCEAYTGGVYASVDAQVDHLRAELRPRESPRAAPELVVIVSYRVAEGDTERLRNLLGCLLALHAADDTDRIELVAVEQDDQPRTSEVVGPLVDRYVHARNDGLFNYAWGRNVGVRASSTDAPVCLLDADMVVPPDFARRCTDALGSGVDALLPYDRLLYLDARSSARVVGDLVDRRQVPSEGRGLRGYLMREIYGGAVVTTRELYDRVGGQDERYRGWGDEDNEFYRMLRRHGVLARNVGWLYHLDHARPVMRDGDQRINRVAMAAPREPGGAYGDITRYSPAPVVAEDAHDRPGTLTTRTEP